MQDKERRATGGEQATVWANALLGLFCLIHFRFYLAATCESDQFLSRGWRLDVIRPGP